MSEAKSTQAGLSTGAYRLAFEWFPQDRPVEDDKSGFPGAWNNLSRRDVVDVHDAYNVVFAIATSF